MSDETYQPKEPTVDVVPSVPEGPPKEVPVAPASVTPSEAPKVDVPAQVTATAAVVPADKSYGRDTPAPQAPLGIAPAALMADSAGGKRPAPQADYVSAAHATDSAGRPTR